MTSNAVSSKCSTPSHHVHISFNRLGSVLKNLSFLTPPVVDGENRILQLWKNASHGVFGAVYDEQGNLLLIPSSQIKTLLG